jgi:Zn-dependent protease/predicted transcriptional regulator
MRWSYSAGKVFGINFKIHVTFLILLFFIFFVGLYQEGLEKAVVAVLFILAVFASVLIHEIGHSLISRRFGKEAKSITLLPIGGVATIEEMPEKPMQEISMAIIGPFINLAIAGILFLFVGHWSGISFPNLYPDSAKDFVAGLIGVNVILAIFNLIPAFPMDGGRVLRGFLSMWLDYSRATSVAVHIGQGIALFFIFFGIFFNWWLALIGLFLYIGAGSENQEVMLRAMLRRGNVSDAMSTDLRGVRPDDPLAKALELAYHGFQDDFPVIDEQGIQGILTREKLLQSIHDKGTEVSISDIMEKDFDIVSPGMKLDEIYQGFRSGDKSSAVVMENNRFVGMISMSGISRYIMIRSALKRS